MSPDSLSNLLSLLFFPQCPLCQRPAKNVFCHDCTRQLKRQSLSNPRLFWQGELPLFVWGNYGGVVKRAIASLKYDRHPNIAKPLGHWLGEAWLNASISPRTPKITVIPIPLHSSKLKQRGYNQAELIARSFCQYTGLKLQVQGLERVRDTTAQFGLKRSERLENLEKAFRVRKELLRRLTASPVLLLDDIYTTGATVSSAAKTLQQQGIQVWGVVAVATSKTTQNP